MAFSKNRRLADLVSSAGEVSSFVDASVTHADLHTSMDLTGKTVTVANASTGDSDTTAANTAFVQQEIAALVDSAPGTLNTLNELAAALGDDASFSTTVTNSIALKAPLASPNFTGNVGIGAASPGANLAFGGSNAGIWLNNDGTNPFGIDTVAGELRLFTGNSATYQMKFGKMATDGTTFTSHLTIGDDGSNRGHVGIGTTVPQKLLDITDSSSGESIPVVVSNKDVTAGTGQKVTLGFGLSRNSGAFKPEAGTIEVGRDADWTSADTNIDSYMAFSTYLNNAATEKMRIDSSGNVGIGTNAPGSYQYSSSDRNLVIEAANGARLVLLGDSGNSGDSGEEDGSIYMMSDGSVGTDPFGNTSSYAFGYALKNRNYSGIQDFDLTEWRNGDEAWNSRIYIQGTGVGTDSKFVFNGGRSNSGDTSTYPNDFAAPNSDFEIRTSGSMTVPKGTTSDRPSGTTSGRLRFNTTTTKPEIHDGAGWKILGYGAYTADWLVVAGGGSGGDCTSPARHGGGGGAGGLRTSYGSTSGGGSSAELAMSITSGTVYTITVGAGGASIGSSHDTTGNNGANSSISGAGLTTITSLGGGGGGGNSAGANSGGSGGGGSESDGAGGSGTSGQGYAGGTGSEGGDRGGGGGGAGAVGGTTVGGAGLAVSITGSSVTYAGGGGTQGAGGAGGGGAASTAGTANTGGGGGAAGSTSGAGGSGVVILRVPTLSYSGTVTGSPTVTTTGSDTVIKFTGSGTYTG